MRVHRAKIVLRRGMALLRGGNIVGHGLAVISPNTLTMFVQITQSKFRLGRTPCGGLTVPRSRFVVVLRNTRTGHIGPAEQVFRLRIASLRSLLERVKLRGPHHPLASCRPSPCLALFHPPQASEP